ncbi:acetylcholine receptor subunit beta-like 2 [Diaphorina citri]|uniref:Acetylcholine receptor subunit beta-like 2 n=1 Tax=Diaphorina citri TaxID=121845 RepID=A0A1S4EKF3_DIACI|nr:acetylcholine receptor subunit beta-like 2 [Diaphorina citri]
MHPYSHSVLSVVADADNVIPRQLTPEILSAFEGVRFIAQHIKDADKDNEIVEDWKYVSMVLDRFFLCVFTAACVLGTCGIIFQAPSLYDNTAPIDIQMTRITQYGISSPPTVAPRL